MKIDILGGSYQQKYKSLNSQRTINWYVVPGTQEEKNKSEQALFPFPGLTSYVTLPGTYFRGLCVANTHNYNNCYAVVDNILYQISTNKTYTTIGTMSNLGIGSSKIYMTSNYNDEVGIFGYNAAYVYNMGTGALTQITTAQYPGTATTADYMDGYTFITSGGSTYFNTVASLLSWTITNTFSPTFKTNPVIAIAALKEDIYNFTSETIEHYINDGNTPWSRQPKSTVYIGLEAKDSLVTFNDGFLFLGKNAKGETAIYFFDGGNGCTPISPFSINWALNATQARIDDSYAFMQYSKNGNIFYYLTVPELKTTFVYDVVTKTFQERQSQQPYLDSDGSQIQREFRGKHFVNFQGMHLFGDLYSGKVFLEDYTAVLDDTQPIIRTRISQTFNQEYKNIGVNDFELDLNSGSGVTTGQGSDPVLNLSLSFDGGYTYHSERNIRLGTIGQHSYRARLRMLGTSRNWTIKLVLSDPVDLCIQSCVARGVIGSS